MKSEILTEWRIVHPAADKKQYLDLLLLGDEQESMIDRYLYRGELFVWFAPLLSVPTGVAVVTDEGEGTCELKNIAVAPPYQRMGFGRKMIDFLCQHYRPSFQRMLVGTGNSLQTTSFYQRCGFCYSHTVKDFFIQHYDHLIIEEGKILTDMIYFSKPLH